MIKVFRIENPLSKHGMWYRADGTFDPFILKLTEGRSKHLPMEFDERYRKDGNWFSAGASRKQMNQWFSPLDAFELTQNGYSLFEFTVDKYKVEEHQVLFLRGGIIKSESIPLEALWDFSQVK